MRVFRRRAGPIASFILCWQIAVLLTATLAARCLNETSAPVAREMANCPMHQPPPDPICRAHAPEPADRDCECPKLGRSQGLSGLTALFGAVGVLPTILEGSPLALTEHTVLFAEFSDTHHIADPVAPPPRA